MTQDDSNELLDLSGFEMTDFEVEPLKPERIIPEKAVDTASRQAGYTGRNKSIKTAKTRLKIGPREGSYTETITIRAEPDIVERFRQICAARGWKTGMTLAAMVELFESGGQENA